MNILNKIITIMIMVCVSFAGIPENVIRITFMSGLQDTVESSSDLEEKLTVKPEGFRYPGRAMLYSGIVPGLGEYYSGNWKRALIFAGIEVASWSIWLKNDKDGEDQTTRYENYADENWKFSRWISDYYSWEDDATHLWLFSDSLGFYDDLWDASHHVSFHYTNNQTGTYDLMSTNTVKFEEFYVDYFDGLSEEQVTGFIEDDDIRIVQDHSYYENIGKYNHFFAGWVDNDSLSIYDNDGYLVARSPKKWEYREMRKKANDFKTIAGYALSAMMLNHVASMIDAVFTTQAWNRKYIPNISARTSYHPKNKNGIGSTEVFFTWKL